MRRPYDDARDMPSEGVPAGAPSGPGSSDDPPRDHPSQLVEELELALHHLVAAMALAHGAMVQGELTSQLLLEAGGRATVSVTYGAELDVLELGPIEADIYGEDGSRVGLVLGKAWRIRLIPPGGTIF